MPCEKFKPALIEAAATGADLPPALRAHADACPSCAADLAGQRTLIAAIDASVRQTVNAPLPPALLHRFEARLAQEPQSLPSRSLKFRWLYAAAAFTTVAAMILFAMPKLHTHKPKLQTVALSQAAPLQTARSTTDNRPQVIPMPLKPIALPETRRVKHHSQAVAASQPEILVPPDEQIALTKLVAHWNARREFVVALATPVHQGFETSFKGLEIPEINTAEIVIQPIATESRR